MKFSLIFFLPIFLIFIDGKGQIIIEGKIHNYDGKSEVYYHPTLEGIYSPTWKTLQPNSRGEFKIKYKNEGYGTTSISFNKLNYRFFHDGNSHISFEIDQDKIRFPKRIKSSVIMDSLKDQRAVRAYHTRLNIARDKMVDSLKQLATLSVNGDFKDVNTYYNSNIRTSYLSSRNPAYNYYAQFIHMASNPEEVLQIIDSLTRIENDQVELLGHTLHDENIDAKTASEEVKTFLKNEIMAFYGGIFLSGMFGKQYDQLNGIYNNPDTILNAYNRGWEKLVEHFFSEISESVTLSPASLDVNELVQWLKIAKKDYQRYDVRPSSKSNDQYIIKALLNPDSTLLNNAIHLDDKSILAAKVSSLHLYLNNQTFYSPTLLYAYNELKKQYPNSIHIIQFEPQLEKLKAYLKSSSENFDKAKFIDTNYYQFQDLLKVLKGKNIFVDIWATWCGPCIDEFKYKSTIQPYIDRGELTVLYISIDKERWEKKWRDNIKYNQLEGYHVLANDVLIKDMWNYLGGMQGAIPRYALINEEGKLIENDAAKPRKSEKLIKQIEDLLSSNQ